MNVLDCMTKGPLGVLKYCLVGSWTKTPNPSPMVTEVEKWARRAWRLKGNLMVVHLNSDLLFFEFVDSEDAKWVFEVGRRSFRGSSLQLEWWNPEVGCLKRNEMVKEAWIRVVGLPLHLWKNEFFKKIGDSCGGFLALDKETASKTTLLWARILVKLGGKERPSMLNVEAGSRSYELQVWWELPPWVASLYLAKGKEREAT